ncbi:MAG: SpoIIE family protein phosphatase [Calditrichae bacterium]|nr:SpoIIE family protein phosphatase [Calditrichia bacterium]
MSDLKLKKRWIRYLDKDNTPTLIVDEEGEILFFNEPVRNGLNSFCPEQYSGENISFPTRVSKQLINSKFSNIIPGLDSKDFPCQISPLQSFENGGKQLFLVRFNTTEVVERYLHYLDTINKISSKSYRYKRIHTLARFVVNELYNEEYNFFHVGLFLIDYFSNENRVKLIAVAGESRDIFKKYCAQKYIQSTKIGVIGKVFESGKTLVLQDTSKVDYYYSTPYFRGQSEICTPILISNEIVGVVNIESREKVNFDDADALFLESVADIFAANLSRINTTEEISKKNTKLRKYLQELKTAKEALELQSVDLKRSLVKGNKVQKLIKKQNELMQSKLQMGAELQKSLLPRTLPELAGLHFSSKYLPNYQLGGDFFDVSIIDDQHVAILIADVSGHGVSAAMIAAMFKAFFNNYRRSTLSPATIMSELNKEFCSIITTGDYITAFLLILDLNNYQIRYCNAGHPFPLLYKARLKSIEELDSEGFFIGIFCDQEFKEKSTRLTSGDKILFYTDGAIDIKNENNRLYGRRSLKKYFKKITESGLRNQSTLNSIFHHLKSFALNSAFDDDMTLLLLERTDY